MNHARDPLTIKGSIERIALLPLNYTRYNTIIVYKRIFCRTREYVLIMQQVHNFTIIRVLTCFVKGPPNEIQKRGRILFLDFFFAEGIKNEINNSLFISIYLQIINRKKKDRKDISNDYQSIRYKEGFFRALLFVLFVYAMYHKHNNSFF